MTNCVRYVMEIWLVARSGWCQPQAQGAGLGDIYAALRLMQTRAVRFEPLGTSSQRDARVALCFKVPFRFRQWFKLQALREGLTMTDFLIKSTESYVEAHKHSSTPDTEAGSEY